MTTPKLKHEIELRLGNSDLDTTEKAILKFVVNPSLKKHLEELEKKFPMLVLNLHNKKLTKILRKIYMTTQ